MKVYLINNETEVMASSPAEAALRARSMGLGNCVHVTDPEAGKTVEVVVGLRNETSTRELL